MNTRTTTRRTNESMLKQCYVCGAATYTRLFVNNLCPSCRTPTAPETTLEETCGRIADNNPISGTHALRTAHAVPHVPASTSTNSVPRTGNTANSTGVTRTGTTEDNVGRADITLDTADTCSPVRTTEVPVERDQSVLVTAEPNSVRGDLVPQPDSPRTAYAARAVNQESSTLPDVTLGTQPSSQDAPATVHPGKGSRAQANAPIEPRSVVYIPNGKHRRCSFTPQKQSHTDKEYSKDT
jgi:hypothetical protein